MLYNTIRNATHKKLLTFLLLSCISQDYDVVSYSYTWLHAPTSFANGGTSVQYTHIRLAHKTSLFQMKMTTTKKKSTEAHR
jgi:hypothetical protein